MGFSTAEVEVEDEASSARTAAALSSAMGRMLARMVESACCVYKQGRGEDQWQEVE